MPYTKSISFGELLKKYRYDSGFSQVDLAEALENHQPVISNFERNRSKPSRDEILAIAKVLKLNEKQTNDLLVSAEYAPLSNDIFISGDVVDPVNIYNLYNQTGTVAPYRELNIQIQDIKDTITNIGEHLEKNDSPKSPSQSEQLLAQIQDLQTAMSELQATSKEITAPVALPSPKQLEVKLIPTTSFERLEEYRSEENKWFTWAGIFLGAVIGVFINLVTGGEANETTWIVAGTFFIMVIFSGLSAWRYSQRATKLRDEIVDKKASSNQGSIAKDAG